MTAILLDNLARRLCSAVSLFLFLPWTSAHGVCLNGHPSIGDEYKRSKVVVLAIVVGQRDVPETSDGFYLEGTIYNLKIERAFHGNAGSNAEIFSENSSGRFPMVVGSKYLLFIYQEHDRLLVDNCGNSGVASERGTEIQAVERLAARKP